MLLLIFLPVGTSTDIWMALDLAITVAEQIRCPHSSQDHIIHSTGNHCHSLNHVPSLSVSLAPSLPLSLTRTHLHLAHSYKTLIIKLEQTQGQCFISFPKGNAENVN